MRAEMFHFWTLCNVYERDTFAEHKKNSHTQYDISSRDFPKAQHFQNPCHNIDIEQIEIHASAQCVSWDELCTLWKRCYRGDIWTISIWGLSIVIYVAYKISEEPLSCKYRKMQIFEFVHGCEPLLDHEKFYHTRDMCLGPLDSW